MTQGQIKKKKVI